jgi:hypothetical protein
MCLNLISCFPHLARLPLSLTTVVVVIVIIIVNNHSTISINNPVHPFHQLTPITSPSINQSLQNIILLQL